MYRAATRGASRKTTSRNNPNRPYRVLTGRRFDINLHKHGLSGARVTITERASGHTWKRIFDNGATAASFAEYVSENEQEVHFGARCGRGHDWQELCTELRDDTGDRYAGAGLAYIAEYRVDICATCAGTKATKETDD